MMPTSSYVKQNKFQVDDKVWLTQDGGSALKGPYHIAAMPSPGRYTLCYEDGAIAENGNEFEERLLDFVD
jgi:hypothetical protein